MIIQSNPPRTTIVRFITSAGLDTLANWYSDPVGFSERKGLDFARKKRGCALSWFPTFFFWLSDRVTKWFVS